MPSIRFSQVIFSTFTYFDLYGSVAFYNCTFPITVQVQIHETGSQNEIQAVGKSEHKIHFDRSSIFRLKIAFQNVMSHLSLTDSEITDLLKVTNTRKYAPMEGCYINNKNLVQIDIKRCTVMASMELNKISKGSKGYTEPIYKLVIMKTFFQHSSLKIRETAKVKLTNNTFFNTYLKIEGIVKQPLCAENPKISLFQEKKISKIFINSSYFQDIPRTKDKGICVTSGKDSILSCKKSHLTVANSNFKMNCIVSGGFIEVEKDRSYLKILDSFFTAREIKSTVPIITVPQDLEHFSIENVKIECMLAVGYDWLDVRYILQCKSYCEQGQYKINSRHAAVALVTKTPGAPAVLKSTAPACPVCPMGATCDGGGIIPLPDYWGYSHGDELVKMVRCPKDYCCTDSKDCQTMDSCNGNRIGTICGKCRQNMTEALFSVKCVSTDNCQMALILILYILAAVCYALFLMSFRDIKKIILKKMKNLAKTLKRKFRTSKPVETHEHNFPEQLAMDSTNPSMLLDSLLLSDYRFSQRKCVTRKNKSLDHIPSHNKGKEYSTEIFSSKWIDGNCSGACSSEKAKMEKETDSGMKYLQILFYYIQDATLFKVYLPAIGTQQESWLVHFLQFSPDILFVYTRVSDMCFVPNTTAILKVSLRALFGPCVMLILLSIYGVQWMTSILAFKNLSFYEPLKSKLCEAFLLTVLLSYQKIVQGAFTLVKCVQIGQDRVLHIQGDVSCGTWWQTSLEVYLYTCVVPVFVVLALGPYYVKHKELSVPAFVLACVFPMPVIFYFIITKLIRNKIFSASTTDTKTEPPQDTVIYTKSEEVVTEYLLKHYRTLNIKGISMTWLGFHKLYRMTLVACNTYITEPLPRLCAMTTLVLAITFVTIFLKPYKEQPANKTAILSHAGSICIAVINIVKSTLIAGIYDPNYLVRTITYYLDLCETILLTWVPVVAISMWLFYSLLQHIRSKGKSRKNKLKIEA